MTNSEMHTAAHALLKTIGNFFGQLKDRWLDERDYEDFKGYAAAAKHYMSERLPESDFQGWTKSGKLTFVYNGCFWTFTFYADGRVKMMGKPVA